MSDSTIDFDGMSDEDFESLVDDVQSGKYDDDSLKEDSSIENDYSSEESVDDKNIEDTDHDDYDLNEESDSETNEYGDDDTDDTEDDIYDDDDSEDGENTQDDGSSNDEVEDKSADNTSQDEVNYKAEYERTIEELNRMKEYKAFYDKATSEFVANGKTMKGFKDPDKIIQAQQMAAGYSEKMRAFKEYRPFINPLKEHGILDNPDKFNLMMNAMSGDKEAVKAFLKQSDIDPLELDMEEVNYKPTNVVASPLNIAVEDLMDNASQFGVQDRVNSVISKDWDNESVLELLEDPHSTSDLVSHMSNGVYDMVQERIAQKKMTDVLGTFSNKKSIDQYKEAVIELENEVVQAQRAAEINRSQNAVNTRQSFDEAAVQAEIAKIKAEREYSFKVKEKNEAAEHARKKAASVSKKKTTTRKKSTKFDPMKLDDEKFEEFYNSLMYS
jgi:hypothetical protein